jgi:hypothetical protein
MGPFGMMGHVVKHSNAVTGSFKVNGVSYESVTEQDRQQCFYIAFNTQGAGS